MSQYVDFYVRHLNELNSAMKLVPALAGQLPENKSAPEWVALVAVHVAVEREIYRLRKEIAAECEPWFDESAFRIESLYYPLACSLEREEAA